MTYLVATTLAVLLIQLGLLWRLTRALGRLRSVDERITRFGDALSLLTETADAGFRSVAGEVERLATPDPGGQSARARRIAEAIRQGQTATEVAAGERVSEGEVRLRMHLAPPTSDCVHDAAVVKRKTGRSRPGAAATPTPAVAARRKTAAAPSPADE